MNISGVFQTPLAVGLLLTVMTEGPAPAQQQPGPKPDANEIGEIVKQYILDNPQVLLESVRRHQDRERAAQRQRSRDTIAAHRLELDSDPASPVSESAMENGKPVTVVSFFDYRCPHCKRADDTVAKLAAELGVRVVYKEFPILGLDSVLASQAALAAAKQGAYLRFHRALMTSTAPITVETIEQTAISLGLDAARLKKDMTSADIDAALTRNHELAGKLGVHSTPTFIVGDELVTGSLTVDAFRPLIEAARAGAKAAAPQPAGGSL